METDDKPVAESETPPSNRGRKAWVAAIFSLLLPGLGQYYNGQFRKAALIFTIGLFAPGIFLWTPFALTLEGAIALLTAFVTFRIYAIAEALLSARRIGVVPKGRHNLWYSYLMVAVGMFLLSEASRILFLRAYKRIGLWHVPTGAMEPGLLQGDRFVSDPIFYDTRDPKREEILVLRARAMGNLIVTKRCVAIEGDTVQLKAMGLYVNDKRLAGPRAEGNRGAFYYTLLRDGPITIPAGHCFVLGDNADASLDSRDWGLFGKQDLLGKANYIYWSKNLKRIGTKFP